MACCSRAIFLVILASGIVSAAKRKCAHRRISASPTFVSNNEIEEEHSEPQPAPATSFRTAQHDVYLWPSLTDQEKTVIRQAFHQIARRTCIRFNELDYKPWYHASRWEEGKPYVVIRKSNKFAGYTDNIVEDVNRRSLIYLTDAALNSNEGNSSRGMVMEQLLRFMGYREEHLRPDAPSYLQAHDPASNALQQNPATRYSNEQLQWPFDPESVTIPASLRHTHHLTIYCQARNDGDIGAGQRTGLLTRWDAVKLNSMYCPHQVGYADPRLGPCVLPRKSRISG
ncbi:astacin (Peptidase family m12A) domain-containing protein [Ditylenchus destructor]|uniref:Astacin (Peptidase family m12A) domain-containing protein n=1 Tax=Ditylenchus destructor TaxID=166010 RepID=A0AAD4MZ65_9BILA|nr:astacin (Peptidase family m12A) domain-containing protein [Ditylenchus destructor]